MTNKNKNALSLLAILLLFTDVASGTSIVSIRPYIPDGNNGSQPLTSDQIKRVIEYQQTGTDIFVLDSSIAGSIKDNKPDQIITGYIKPNTPFYLWLNLFIPKMIKTNSLYISIYQGEVPQHTYTEQLSVKPETAIQQYPYSKQLTIDKDGNYNIRVFFNDKMIYRMDVNVVGNVDQYISTQQPVSSIPPYEFSSVMLNGQNTNKITAKMGDTVNMKFKVSAPPGTDCPGCVTYFVWGYYNEKGESGGESCALRKNCQIGIGDSSGYGGAYSEGSGMQADCDVPFVPTKPGTYYFTAARLWDYSCKEIKFDVLTNKPFAIIEVK